MAKKCKMCNKPMPLYTWTYCEKCGLERHKLYQHNYKLKKNEQKEKSKRVFHK